MLLNFKMKLDLFGLILFLLGFVHGDKIKETWCPINNVMRKNTKNEVRVFLTVNVMGLILCGKMCNEYPDCGAINFNRDLMRCELVSIGATESELINAEKWKHMNKADFLQMYGDQVSQNCGTSTRCLKLRSGQLQRLSTDLTYKDCLYTPSPGIYNVQISSTSHVKALCLAGGWMVFQHKKLTSLENFVRPWSDYKNGFGNPDEEHWLGNEHVYQYTLQGPTELRIELNNDSNVFAQYGTFQLSNEAEKYKLSVGQYTGNAGNSLQYSSAQYWSDGKMFTTIDSDNDINTNGNCAENNSHGAWWMGWCTVSSLNGSKVKWMLQSRNESRVMIRRKQ